ncbi:glycoside hydrolase [Mycena olivaceomarginata]|nr:glycoside hydrolase [Mycena olivaceomarginata]
MRSFFTVVSLLALARAAVIPLRRSLNERQDAAEKLVVAHFMVGNTFPYTLQDWTDDINLATASGLSGFALNVGGVLGDFQDTQTANAFQAAEAIGPDFKLFFSLDMSALACATVDDGAALRTRVTNFISRPNYLQRNGKAFVSTFAGEQCTFGQGSVGDGWKTQFAQHPDLQGKMEFVPAFFIDPATFSPQFSGVMDGDFNFNSGWPLESLATLAAGGAKLTYMAAVSPWFFTHFGPDSFNKNVIHFPRRSTLYSRRWENLIAERDQIDLVEVVTWNDYGESHYIGPIKGALPPGSEAWVNGFPHQASDALGPPTTFQVTQDAVWAVVMATAPGSVTLSTTATDAQTFDVQAGINKFSIPIAPGGTLNGVLSRNGANVVQLATPGTDFTFNGAPTTFNYNTFVASAVAA